MANLYETKAIHTDGLVASENPAPEAFSVTIKANAGSLKRGTVLSVESDGKMAVLGKGSGTANCILCDDVVVGASDVKAVAYRTGHFVVEKLQNEITAEDKENLRAAGILLSNAVAM